MLSCVELLDQIGMVDIDAQIVVGGGKGVQHLGVLSAVGAVALGSHQVQLAAVKVGEQTVVVVVYLDFGLYVVSVDEFVQLVGQVAVQHAYGMSVQGSGIGCDIVVGIMLDQVQRLVAHRLIGKGDDADTIFLQR